jgi:UDP-N-acetyl-D-glucosamine/UDP-N-acetyl-D-galactosamine dehydrogenase
VIRELQDFGCAVDVYDPWADAGDVEHEYGITLVGNGSPPGFENYDAVVFAVAHDVFRDFDVKPNGNLVVYDIKSVLAVSDGAL